MLNPRSRTRPQPCQGHLQVGSAHAALDSCMALVVLRYIGGVAAAVTRYATLPCCPSCIDCLTAQTDIPKLVPAFGDICVPPHVPAHTRALLAVKISTAYQCVTTSVSHRGQGAKGATETAETERESNHQKHQAKAAASAHSGTGMKHAAHSAAKVRCNTQHHSLVRVLLFYAGHSLSVCVSFSTMCSQTCRHLGLGEQVPLGLRHQHGPRASSSF